MEESLREAACLGNMQAVEKLLRSGANINSQNSMNGWTALHWACKRGHASLVQHLLQSGADVNIKTTKGERPSNVTTSNDILSLLGISGSDEGQKEESVEDKDSPPIVPHYLQHPVFPYYNIDIPPSPSKSYDPDLASKFQKTVSIAEERNGVDTESKTAEHGGDESVLYVKARISDSGESDFIEVEVPSLTYSALLKACCEEMDLSSTNVAKIRKLPNIWVHKDRDVQRMKEGQELEIVLKSDNEINDNTCPT